MGLRHYPGGLIRAQIFVPTGGTAASTASGVWLLNHAYFWRRVSYWPSP